jgi:formate hydrogenlyase subunit 6/NADH:ubiquinone oxidoreductase subunit I
VEEEMPIGREVVIEREQFPILIQALRGRGYQVIGPRARDGAIVYDELTSADDLPIGYTDEQQAGTYRLRRRGDSAVFGYTVGPHSWKRFLHPPVLRLSQARRTPGGFGVSAEQEQIPKRAFVGVRSCELHAIAIQDRVFLGGPYVDPAYRARRENLFIVAVNCSHAGGTCFCVSMRTGPKSTSGFDLALTEVLEDHRHHFVVEIGSAAGAELLGEVPHATANDGEREAAKRVIARTAASMGRTLDTTSIHERLQARSDHPRWEETAKRCLSCGNCTMVCPTCFCTTVEDVTDLTGSQAERVRRWDSCFTLDFSYLHGGSVRSSGKARYRQWLTHKFSTWFDQFGSSGCVGCGRCITWCPTAIDVTEEIPAICGDDAVPGNPTLEPMTGPTEARP